MKLVPENVLFRAITPLWQIHTFSKFQEFSPLEYITRYLHTKFGEILPTRLAWVAQNRTLCVALGLSAGIHKHNQRLFCDETQMPNAPSLKEQVQSANAKPSLGSVLRSGFGIFIFGKMFIFGKHLT